MMRRQENKMFPIWKKDRPTMSGILGAHFGDFHRGGIGLRGNAKYHRRSVRSKQDGAISSPTATARPDHVAYLSHRSTTDRNSPHGPASEETHRFAVRRPERVTAVFSARNDLSLFLI